MTGGNKTWCAGSPIDDKWIGKVTHWMAETD